MNRSSFLFLSFIIISIINHIEDRLQVNVNIIGKATIASITIAIDVENLSAQPIEVNKTRIVDYKWEKIGSIGNYIIEMQILDNGKYRLLQPSADILPGYNKEEITKIGSGKFIRDTVRIRGYSFASNGGRGFQPGQYRLRATFNSLLWGGGQSGISEWIEFEIGIE